MRLQISEFHIQSLASVHTMHSTSITKFHRKFDSVVGVKYDRFTSILLEAGPVFL